MNDNYLKDVIGRFERLKEFAFNHQYTSDIPKEEIEYINNILRNIENEILRVRKRYQRYISEYEKVRNDKVDSGVFSVEFDDKDNPFNDREQLDDYNSQVVKILSTQIDEFEKFLRMYNQPYFGKLNVDIGNSSYNLYLGRSGYSDSLGKSLIVDWRAPIASLFYSPIQEDALTSININDRDVEVRVDSKQYFDISRGSITSIYTPKSGNRSADLYLEKELTKKISSKLTDIISTIQDKQNRIIRAGINKPMIIQGVAGSGKTTILFHRLAYLVYSYKEYFKSDNSLLIVPNNTFKKYTEDIIPSLGLIGLKVDTLLSFYREYMNLPINLILKESVNQDNTWFCLDIREKVSKCLSVYIDDVLTEVIKTVPNLKDYIENYKVRVMDNNSIPYYERLGIILESAVNDCIADRFPKIDEKKREVKVEKLTEQYSKVIERMLNMPVLLEYLVLNSGLYNDDEISHHTDSGVIKYNRDIKDAEEGSVGNTPYYLYKKDYSYMMEIFITIFGIHDKFDLVSVDEAQEMSPLDVYILEKLTKKSNIILAGDVSQVLTNTEGTDWSPLVDVLNSFSEQNVEIEYLDVSYRSTKEIVELVNNVSKKFVKQNIVGQFSIPDSYEESKRFDQSLKNVINSGYNNVAVIVSNDDSVENVKRILSQEGLFDSFNNNWGNDAGMGLWLLTPDQARGLEFDAVLLYGFNPHNIENIGDYNRFYVSATRAMKKLILCTDQTL